MTTSPILIIGKNGKTGSRVNQRLLDLGYETLGVSRSTAPAFDWQNPKTWEPVMQGIHTAYVTYQPDLAFPEAETAMKEFVRIARTSGLQHLILLSGRGEPGAQKAEEVLRNSGLAWNIVRSSWFLQNFSESFLVDGILAGELFLPVNDTVEPFVDADDIAEVVVAAIRKPELRNRLFEVTGSQALTFAQCVDVIAHKLNRPIQFTSVPLEDYIEALRNQGVPEDMQWLLRELFTVVFDGRNSIPAYGIEEALGRSPSTLEAYVEKTQASGVWDPDIRQEVAGAV